MSDVTPRLKLPYILQNQAQKEVTHAVGLNGLDALTQTAVESISLTTPPAGIEGNLYIVGVGATGAWSAKDNQLAQFIGGNWVFYRSPGMGSNLAVKVRYGLGSGNH